MASTTSWTVNRSRKAAGRGRSNRGGPALIPMIHHFPEHLVAAARDEDLVLLDLRRGDYVCAPGAAAGLRIDRAHQRAEALDGRLVAALVDADCLRPGPGARARIDFPPPAARDLAGTGAVRLSRAPRKAIVAAILDMVSGYWTANFPQIVSRARQRQSAVMAGCSPARVMETAQAVAEILPWVPFQGDCLFRALLLQAALRRRGHGASLVLGVQTWPFEAHAWVQSGDLVLDDGLDHVSGFTPILAV